jgi:hypothetical protein
MGRRCVVCTLLSAAVVGGMRGCSKGKGMRCQPTLVPHRTQDDAALVRQAVDTHRCRSQGERVYCSVHSIAFLWQGCNVCQSGAHAASRLAGALQSGPAILRSHVTPPPPPHTHTHAPAMPTHPMPCQLEPPRSSQPTTHRAARHHALAQQRAHAHSGRLRFGGSPTSTTSTCWPRGRVRSCDRQTSCNLNPSAQRLVLQHGTRRQRPNALAVRNGAGRRQHRARRCRSGRCESTAMTGKEHSRMRMTSHAAGSPAVGRAGQGRSARQAGCCTHGRMCVRCSADGRGSRRRAARRVQQAMRRAEEVPR